MTEKRDRLAIWKFYQLRLVIEGTQRYARNGQRHIPTVPFYHSTMAAARVLAIDEFVELSLAKFINFFFHVAIVAIVCLVSSQNFKLCIRLCKAFGNELQQMVNKSLTTRASQTTINLLEACVQTNLLSASP